MALNILSGFQSPTFYTCKQTTQRAKEPIYEPILHSHQLEISKSNINRDCRLSLSAGVDARNAVVTGSRLSSVKN